MLSVSVAVVGDYSNAPRSVSKCKHVVMMTVLAAGRCGDVIEASQVEIPRGAYQTPLTHHSKDNINIRHGIIYCNHVGMGFTPGKIKVT